MAALNVSGAPQDALYLVIRFLFGVVRDINGNGKA